MSIREVAPVGGAYRMWLVGAGDGLEIIVGQLTRCLPEHDDPRLWCEACESESCEHTAAVREVVDASEGE